MMNITTIDSLDIFGQGVAHIDGKCHFLSGGLPGEEVRYEVTEEKKRYSRGHVVEILHGSPQRVLPMCSHYAACGGCSFQHVDYAAECAAKEQHVLHTLRDVPVEMLTPAPSRYHYRNKVTFHAEHGAIGFYAKGSRHVVPIEQCPLLQPPLNFALACLRRMDCSHADEIMLRTNGEDVAVFLRGHFTKAEKEQFVADLRNLCDEVSGITFDDNSVFGQKRLEMTMNGHGFPLSPPSFFQVNSEAAAAMFRYADTLLKREHGDVLLDLYCGVGTAAILLGTGFKEVYGMDIVPAAIEDAVLAASKMARPATFIAAKAEDGLDKFLRRIPKANAVIVDPPRQGMAKSVTERLCAYGADQLLYISCDVSTLKRDLSILEQSYNLVSAAPFDLFPRTSHVETVVLLSKVEK